MTGETAAESSGSATLLGVFARYWQPGSVKTRLAAKVGNEAAAKLHRQFVEATLLRLRGIADCQWLCITPDSAISAAMAECPLASDWTLLPQASGSLGSRMLNFFEAALSRVGRAVLVGSDSPDLPLEHVAQAFASLNRVPVVLGPAADGGYYLIGIAATCGLRNLPYLFEDIPWSTPEVLGRTRQRLEDRGMEFCLLPAWHDVDVWPDLVALDRRLSRCQTPVDGPLAALAAEVAPLIAIHTAETA